jgi:hypothetical protein
MQKVMKTITHTALVLTLAAAIFTSVASAQVSGSGGGEGTGSSRHFETLGVNPQNIGIATNTASAGTNGLSTTLLALTVGILAGGAAYLSLNKVLVRAEA